MRPPFAMMAIAGALAAPIALAQAPAPTTNAPSGGLRRMASVPPLTPTSQAPAQGTAQAPAPAQTQGSATSRNGPFADLTATNGGTNAKVDPAKKDSRVYEASTSLPVPTIPDQVPAPAVALPTDPIEPYLLTRNAGPFMVMAKTFRGPDAERWALALLLELRNDYGLPAYILRTRDFPMRSNIRTIPPTALREQPMAHVTDPEKTRTYDEAMVLVGNEKTLASRDLLLHKVKKIKPKCLNSNPSIFHWREGLSTAMGTSNPYVPAQDIFPRKPNVFVKQLNEVPHSIVYCPGRYTLQVAEFGGRASFDPKNETFQDKWFALNMNSSPLAAATEKAKRLADILAKDPAVRNAGAQPYVFHGLTSSKVMLGAFNQPNDPAAGKLRDTMLKRAIELMKDNDDIMIVPAPALTDVETLKAQMK